MTFRTKADNSPGSFGLPADCRWPDEYDISRNVGHTTSRSVCRLTDPRRWHWLTRP